MRSIAATGPGQVTITLTQPGCWRPGQMASIGRIVIEGSFAQRQGQDYGTPAGSILCPGACTGLRRAGVPRPGWQPRRCSRNRARLDR